MSSERRPARIRQRGFTLLELLVAITLLAILAVLAWRGLDSMTRTREALAQRDERIEALKTAYAQFDADCTQLADPNTLSRSPVELDDDRVLLVRDRRGDSDSGQPPAWQVVLYRVLDGRLERLQSQPITSRSDLRSALDSLRQGGANAARYQLADAIDGISVRAWIEPGGWMGDSGTLSAALFPGGSNTTTLTGLTSASTPSASAAASGVVVPAASVRAVELTLLVRMTPQGAPQRFTRICMTGL